MVQSFTRTTRIFPSQPPSFSASTIVLRAPGLASGAQASSRSRNTWSAGERPGLVDELLAGPGHGEAGPAGAQLGGSHERAPRRGRRRLSAMLARRDAAVDSRGDWFLTHGEAIPSRQREQLPTSDPHDAALHRASPDGSAARRLDQHRQLRRPPDLRALPRRGTRSARRARARPGRRGTPLARRPPTPWPGPRPPRHPGRTSAGGPPPPRGRRRPRRARPGPARSRLHGRRGRARRASHGVRRAPAGTRRTRPPRHPGRRLPVSTSSGPSPTAAASAPASSAGPTSGGPPATCAPCGVHEHRQQPGPALLHDVAGADQARPGRAATRRRRWGARRTAAPATV